MKIKKMILGMAALTVLSVNAMAAEAFLGAGYDFYRHGSNAKINGTADYKTNPKVRAEFLPYEFGNVKAGIGIAHDFGTKSKGGEKVGRSTPVYAVFKPEWEIGNSGTTKFYNKYRLGWALNEGKNHVSNKKGTYVINSDYKSGPMAGLEAGFEFNNVALGLTYDAMYSPNKHGGTENKGTINHQVGMQVGYVFGGAKKYTPAPVVVPKPEPVVVVPTPAPAPATAPAPVVEKHQEQGKAIVNFAFDHPQIDTAKGRNQMNDAIRTLNRMDYVDVDVTGHTDSKGSDAYNEKLGQARANNVAAELRNSTDPSKVKINSVTGKGEKEPIASNATDEGRAENRRVEINFRGWFDQQEDGRY